MEEEGWLLSCARNSAPPPGPGDSFTPLSASMGPWHYDGHKGSLRISQEEKVPLFIPDSSPHFLLAALKEKVKSSDENKGEQREQSSARMSPKPVAFVLSHLCEHLTEAACSWYKQGESIQVLINCRL